MNKSVRVTLNLKRNLIRKIITPFLPYFYDTHVEIGGKTNKLIVGNRVALANTVFNLSSGNIFVGDRTIFTPGVMVITGTHLFKNGMRVSLNPEMDDGSWGGNSHEVPKNGRDIKIGIGCFVGSGAIILGGVNIGDHCIIGAGSVVTKDVPNGSVVMGVTGRIVQKNV